MLAFRRSGWMRLLATLFAIAMVAGACSDDDDSGGGGDGEGSGSSQSKSESRLDVVKDRGTLRCGVNDELEGFGSVDAQGEYSGFDVDFCRVVAAAVLGDADAVEYKPLSAEARFTALQNRDVDILIRNTTYTATRDGGEGLTFLFTTFFDGQGMMVPADSDIQELEDLADANICVLSGTTTELNLTAVFNARNIPFNPVVFQKDTELQPAYEEGQCEAWTTDASGLASFKKDIESKEGGKEQRILSEIISKEPLGPSVLDGDSKWAQAANWAVMATVQAWEFGLTSENVEGFETDDPNIKNFLGQDNFDAELGLPTDFAVQVVKQVGNYQQIYERNITPLGIGLDGSVNDLWTNGGLMYVPPYR